MPTGEEHKTIPYTGKLITAEPATVGENYRELKNLRYRDRHLKGIQGMTKINSAAVMDATYLKTRSGFHFVKTQPAESHVLVQAYNTGLTASQILDNTTAIPGTGNFETTEVFTDSSGSGVGTFADAPDGQIIYCNGVDSCIWGGDEMKLGSFITSTAAVTDTGAATDPKNYTDIINNTRSEADQVAIIGGGIDTNALLMLPCDGADGGTTFTDSIGTHTPVAIGNANTAIVQAKFGTASGEFDGTGDAVTVPDHADWILGTGTGNFCVDFWVRFNAVTGQQCLFSQAIATATDTKTDFYSLFQDHTLGKLLFVAMNSGTRTINESMTWAPVADIWYHVALIRGWGGTANSFCVTVDGTSIGTFTAAATFCRHHGFLLYRQHGHDLWN